MRCLSDLTDLEVKQFFSPEADWISHAPGERILKARYLSATVVHVHRIVEAKGVYTHFAGRDEVSLQNVWMGMPEQEQRRAVERWEMECCLTLGKYQGLSLAIVG